MQMKSLRKIPAMNRFIAIDVETANFEPTSICAIGAAKVCDGIITDRRYSLVRPEPDWYSPACVRVHGITDKNTFNAPSFGTIWASWREWLDGYQLVAHNARFDSRCIKAACRMYGLDEPAPFKCTLMAARKAIPRGVCASKSLDSLCDFFGIPLRHHHCALDDVEACAKLAVILLDD